MKTEFIYQNKFETLEELQLKLAEYIYWYNNMINPQKGQNLKFDSESAIIKEKY
jgi:hypothetical protein